MNEYAATAALIILMIIAVLAGVASRIDSTLYRVNQSTGGRIEVMQ